LSINDTSDGTSPELSGDETFANEVLGVRERVRKILGNISETRNSDRVLFTKFVEQVSGRKLPPEVEDVLLHTPFTTIIKSRQYVVRETPELEPTDPKVKAKRAKARETMRKLHPPDPPPIPPSTN